MGAQSLYLRIMSVGFFDELQLKNSPSFTKCPKIYGSPNFRACVFQASQEPPDDSKSKLYKELGMFSLRKKIEDSILRAQMLTPTVLEVEETNHMNHEEVIRGCDLWDDISRSNEILKNLADSAKVVEALRDIKYKAEEAKLITELAENDSINYALFKQAYIASLDVKKILDNYEMSKLLKEPYDMEGACITIKSKCGDAYSEIWAGQLTQMYLKWAQRQGHAARIVERFPSNGLVVRSATIELEFKFAYGYLSGESGVHSMIRSHETKTGSVHHEALRSSLACVDVIPLFLESSPELSIDDEDITVSYPSYNKDHQLKSSSAVHIRHIPSGLEVQSAGERSRFANKMKALNRLKAKLLVLLRNQVLNDALRVKDGATLDAWSEETRRYVFKRSKMVHDLKSGIQVADLKGVLNGNIDPLIAAFIHSRQTVSR